jgi:hypothetical protein
MTDGSAFVDCVFAKKFAPAEQRNAGCQPAWAHPPVHVPISCQCAWAGISKQLPPNKNRLSQCYGGVSHLSADSQPFSRIGLSNR